MLPAPAASLGARAGAVTLAALAAVLLAAGCAPTDSGTATPTASPSANACAKDSLTLRTAGKFTVGTDKPAYSPWFVDDDPSNGKGFESAVAYAVAKQLGFAPTDITWVVAGFNSVIAPGPKNFDVDVNQVSISDQRKKAVDFSSGYYDVTQALVAVKGNPAASAKSIADLKKVKLGAAVGTTSLKAITDQIQPTTQPAVFDDNDKAKLALSNGQIDALAVDLPTALYMASAEIKDGVVVGQLPNSGGTPEQFGMVLEKGSALTPCVSQAVDALRANGTLTQLEQQWLTSSAGAPVLQ
jgi:polar amino acid transport system substrate-binding protein